MADELIISSDSHVFEPPDLWTRRIDAAFRDRAPRLQRVGDADHLVIEDGQTIAGIGLISNAGARFEAPETISDHGRFEDVHSGGYDPDQHLKDMRLDGVAGEVLYPSQGLFYFKVADSQLMSAIFRTYNDWLAEFCSTAPERLKGIAMINLDDVQEGIQVRAQRQTGSGGRHDQRIPPRGPTLRPCRVRALLGRGAGTGHAAQPAHRHQTARHQQRHGAAHHPGRQSSGHQGLLPATSLCDMLFSGVFERYPDLKVGVVEFELSWVPYLLNTMDYTYRERHEEATYRFKDGLLPSDLFHRQVFLSFQEDAVGIRLRDIIGVDNIMWGSDYPHSESTFPRSRQVLDEILAQVPQEERAKIVGHNAARLYHFDVERLVATSC